VLRDGSVRRQNLLSFAFQAEPVTRVEDAELRAKIKFKGCYLGYRRFGF